jgi:NAD(P)-dependent dehydrogenase (short-subunit alcohol dehydrogenase family)
MGLGKADCELLAAEGATVIVTDREVELAHKVADSIGGDAMALDVTDEAAWADVMRAVKERHGGLDILVNNAGEQHWDKDVTDISEEQLRRTFQTNIFSMFFLTQAAMPHLKEGSAIINCTSVTMYKGSPILLDYSSTKGAITAFTRSLAKNLADKGIRVNAVAPGPIWTPLNPYGGQPKDEIPEFGEDTPLGRPGQPNEVAPSFLFLACEDSSYMIGQVLHPNGGDWTSS